MFDVTHCSVTLDLIIVALGIIGLSILWSRYQVAVLITYLFSMFWVYTLFQADLLQMIGHDAFYWSTAVTLAFGSLLWAIVNVMPGRV